MTRKISKLATFSLLIIVALLLGSCGTKASISAKDFDIRLLSMMTKLDAKELAEISTSIINANKSEFNDITGWFIGKDYQDKDSLQLKTILDSQTVEVELRLNGNKVSDVSYSFSDARIEDVVNFINFYYVGENMSISRYDSETTSFVYYENEDEAIEYFTNSLTNGENSMLIFRWDFTNSSGNNGSISFTYSWSYNTVMGEYITYSYTFRLNN